MCNVLFFDFLHDVVGVQSFSEHIIRAGFDFGSVGEFSVHEELCMTAEL